MLSMTIWNICATSQHIEFIRRYSAICYGDRHLSSAYRVICSYYSSYCAFAICKQSQTSSSLISHLPVCSVILNDSRRCVSDLLFLCGTPIVIIQSLRGEWIFGDAMCKAFLSGNGVNQFASACFMGVLSFDRYLAVCHALKSSKWRTQRYAIALSAGAWFTVIFEMIPLLKFANLIRIPITGTWTCMLFWGSDATLKTLLLAGDDDNATSVSNTFGVLMHEMQLSSRLFTSYLFILSYLLPLICIWFFYTNIIGSLWVRRAQLFGSNGRGNRRTTTKVRITKIDIEPFIGDPNGTEYRRRLHSHVVAILDCSMVNRDGSRLDTRSHSPYADLIRRLCVAVH